MVKIEHGIQIPNTGRRKNYGEEYKLHEMQVGDSILIEDGNVVRRVLAACANRKKDLKEAFTRRTVEGGTRFWRTA